ncbi:CPBP family intramembrane glutamic endopeptidase [Clostridium lundense]|uniref:CPBP family intramembrane glutamic endopeptidase n=1 Tax=Clostridium lundense TaxID=319475 RepID=UPI00048A013C|nr:CPBP family intramembrane glutamic endopeptidase [Clostridium lundense]
MENEVIENKFELSILASFKMLLMYYILIPLIVGLPLRLIALNMSFGSFDTLSIITIFLNDVLTNIVGVKLTLNKIRNKLKVNFKIHYIEKFNFKLLLYTVLLFLGFFVCRQSSIGHLVEKIPLPDFVEKQFENLSLSSTPSIIAASVVVFIFIVIIAPVFEEILIRGIILEGFLNKYKALTAIIVSSLIFGIIHLNIPQFINATLLGLFLAIIYYKTKSLILCIVSHALNNILAIALIFVNFQFNVISLFIGIVLFIVAGIFFIKHVNELPSTTVSPEEDNTSSELPVE